MNYQDPTVAEVLQESLKYLWDGVDISELSVADIGSTSYKTEYICHAITNVYDVAVDQQVHTIQLSRLASACNQAKELVRDKIYPWSVFSAWRSDSGYEYKLGSDVKIELQAERKKFVLSLIAKLESSDK